MGSPLVKEIPLCPRGKKQIQSLFNRSSINMTKIHAFYFSPTGTSKKTLRAILEGLEGVEITSQDITNQGAQGTFGVDEAVVIAFPVYSGRVPEILLDRLAGVRGEDTPVAFIALYGNRHYDDALLEMQDELEKKGFTTLSAAAFIGEHSFSTEERPVAKGRPHKEDLEKARQYGRDLMKLLRENPAEWGRLEVPGDFPYKEKKTSAPVGPETDLKLCTQCGQCVPVCPTEAIDREDPARTTEEKCLKCGACIRICPEGARSFTAPPLVAISQRLYENCQEPREPECFFSAHKELHWD